MTIRRIEHPVESDLPAAQLYLEHVQEIVGIFRAALGSEDPAQRYILCEALRLGSPDQAASDPVLGSGGARNIQLGLKILF